MMCLHLQLTIPQGLHVHSVWVLYISFRLTYCKVSMSKDTRKLLSYGYFCCMYFSLYWWGERNEKKCLNLKCCLFSKSERSCLLLCDCSFWVQWNATIFHCSVTKLHYLMSWYFMSRHFILRHSDVMTFCVMIFDVKTLDVTIFLCYNISCHDLCQTFYVTIFIQDILCHHSFWQTKDTTKIKFVSDFW